MVLLCSSDGLNAKYRKTIVLVITQTSVRIEVAFLFVIMCVNLLAMGFEAFDPLPADRRTVDGIGWQFEPISCVQGEGLIEDKGD